MRNIKYAELVFKLKFTENVQLPKNKILMLNGALLNVLLNFYCINERKCTGCSILSKCLIQRLLGNSYEGDKPLIFQSRNIKPYYLIDCSSEKRNFNKDQELCFNIRLIDEAIDYASQFIYAFDQLGILGLGPNKAKYLLAGIYNNKGNPIFENGILRETNILTEYISDYIACKKQYLTKDSAALIFTKPFYPDRINFKPYIDMKDLCSSIKNRLNSLNILEKQDIKLLDLSVDDENIVSFTLNIIKQSYTIKELDQVKTILGFKGKINFFYNIYSIIDYLIACEKLYIGNHIIFGYGRLKVKEEG